MTIDDVEPQEVFEPLELKVALPETQRRLTVAFRAILVIPQLVVIYLIGIAAGFALLFGWFAALFTGRLPEGIATFLTG